MDFSWVMLCLLACMCSWLYINAFESDLEWFLTKCPFKHDFNVLCAYVSILSTCGFTNPNYFPFPKQCRFKPLRYQGQLQEDLDIFPKLVVSHQCLRMVPFSILVGFLCLKTIVSFLNSWDYCCKPIMAYCTCVWDYAQLCNNL